MSIPMDARYHGSTDANHRSLRFILALCAGWFGLQQILAIFYANGYFYLASLGFSDTSISLTWLSGPVAGMFFQPFIGAVSDHYAHPWGKRRPFIAAGTFVLICAMLSLAWAEEITAAFSGAPRRTGGVQGDHQRTLTWGLFIVATACISIANLAIQPVQLGLRAMIVDLVPIHQQAQAHAWVAKLNLAGSIVGYSIGATDLTKTSSFLGQSQFQILCSLVCLNLLICVSITCYSIQEKQMQEVDCLRPPRSARKYFISLLLSLRNLAVTRKVCAAQFFCWLAWFPVMYYMSKYLGTLQLKESVRISIKGSAPDEIDVTRTGSFGMLIFASASLVMTTILSWLVDISDSASVAGRKSWKQNEYFLSAQWLSLRRIWFICQIIFCICMMSTFIVDSLRAAYVLVALTGIPWAAGTWIPFALISQDIRKSLHVGETGDEGEGDDLSATVVGLHNSAINAPQIAAAIGSSFLFLFLGSQNAASAPAQDGAGLEVWLLRAGGASALVAAWMIRGLPNAS